MCASAATWSSGFYLDANVLWWTSSIDPSGPAASTSHCELNDQPDLCA
jgi:hypothetical protein